MTTLSGSVDNVDPYRKELISEWNIPQQGKVELNCVITFFSHTNMFSYVLPVYFNYVG